MVENGKVLVIDRRNSGKRKLNLKNKTFLCRRHRRRQLPSETEVRNVEESPE